MTTYSVTIYTAAPGTPLKSGGASDAGHMYYTTQMNHERSQSYGFGPIEHGNVKGSGERKSTDFNDYLNPRYSRTLEVTKEQYDELNKFGAHPEKYGFDTNYHGLKNSCIDYTWSALNHVGLHARLPLSKGESVPMTSFEGDPKVLDNINEIQFIKPPISNSPLNREDWNVMPKQGITQKLFTENEPELINPLGQPPIQITKDSSIDDMFDALWAATVNKDDAAARAVGKAYGESADGQAWLAMGRELNQQDKLQEQQAALDAQKLIDQQAALDAQAQVQRGPVMKMG
jgi:hypothetical protein